MKAQRKNHIEPKSRRSRKVPVRLLASAAFPLMILLTALAAAAEDGAMIQCGLVISLEKRLIMERWSEADACERPVRVRFTDRLLGFTCTTENATDRCHAFVPVQESRAFDTAQVFRCVDAALTEEDNGEISVRRMREWAAAPKQCDWDPALGLLAMEVDFDNGQVCVGPACIAVDRLTVIGKVRLKHLVTSAFREFGLMAGAEGVRAISPVRAHAD